MTDLKKRLFAGLLALVLLCAPLSGCAAREAERYDVLASTAPVRAMTAALLEGTGLNCGLVVTESVSCLHDYTLTVEDMRTLEHADVIVINGAERPRAGGVYGGRAAHGEAHHYGINRR